MKTIGLLTLVLFLTTQLFAQQKCLKGNCDTGYGEAIYTDSSTYKGGFVKGMRQGQGVNERKDNLYTGGWSEGCYDGEGKESIKKLINGKYVIQEEFIGTYNKFDFQKGKHIYYGPGGVTDTVLVISGNYKNGILFGEATMARKKDPKWIVYSTNWVDNNNFSKGISLNEQGKILGNYRYTNGVFAELNTTDERMADILAGNVVKGEQIKHAERITNFSQGRFSEIIKWGMMGKFATGFKRYFISPTLYSKKYPIPFGVRFTYELVNDKNKLISRQIKYGNDLECYFDIPEDGDYTIQAAFDFEGCAGCQPVTGIRVQFGLYSLDFVNK